LGFLKFVEIRNPGNGRKNLGTYEPQEVQEPQELQEPYPRNLL
jgi:hypothetical protein